MADLCTSSRPVCPVSEGHPGGDQLVVTGLHGGGHTAQLRDHVDAGHPRATDHGTTHSLWKLRRHQGLLFWLTHCNRPTFSRNFVGTLLFLLFLTVSVWANSNSGVWSWETLQEEDINSLKDYLCLPKRLQMNAERKQTGNGNTTSMSRLENY